MNRDDFLMLNNDYIYFDNGATTFKPNSVVNKVVDYYTKYTANSHRGDYDLSQKVDYLYEETRDKVKDFINASSSKEIIFTSGTTMSLNMIVFGFMKYYLQKGDEVLITKAEHASNVLPWLELEKEIGIVVKYIPLKDLKVDLETVKNCITEKTKVISLAYITNVIGDIRPIKEIAKLIHENNGLIVVDGAQSVPHIKTNVIEDDIDFLAFSAHKMLGPTGTGVLYGKYIYLDKMKPIFYGGGMNSRFESTKEIEYKTLPLRLEAGTQNISGVLGLSASIDYLNSIGMNKIHEHELELKNYLLEKLKSIDNITVYNKNTDSGIVVFNIDNIFSEDTSRYLNHYHIFVRAGNHCTKMVKDELGIKNTCRISFYLYNTKEEIDKLIEVLKNNKDLYEIIL
ncbi:MAG: cysteine desulfurase [Erysipelotrichaceae bacterium]|nr:cysteine desulfurase [Erysipelotrichaceae bacterium]